MAVPGGSAGNPAANPGEFGSCRIRPALKIDTYQFSPLADNINLITVYSYVRGFNFSLFGVEAFVRQVWSLVVTPWSWLRLHARKIQHFHLFGACSKSFTGRVYRLMDLSTVRRGIRNQVTMSKYYCVCWDCDILMGKPELLPGHLLKASTKQWFGKEAAPIYLVVYPEGEHNSNHDVISTITCLSH